MRTSVITGTVLAIMATLQVVPAPIVPLADLIAGIVSGVAGGVVSGGIGVGVSCGTGHCKKDPKAVAYEVSQIAARERMRYSFGKRQGAAPAGVNQQDWDNCYNAAIKQGTNPAVTITGDTNSMVITATNVPSECMVLADFLDGAEPNAPNAVPCGSACITYTFTDMDSYNTAANKLNSIL